MIQVLLNAVCSNFGHLLIRRHLMMRRKLKRSRADETVSKPSLADRLRRTMSNRVASSLSRSARTDRKWQIINCATRINKKPRACPPVHHDMGAIRTQCLFALAIISCLDPVQINSEQISMEAQFTRAEASAIIVMDP
jgi:hypothetical protein